MKHLLSLCLLLPFMAQAEWHVHADDTGTPRAFSELSAISIDAELSMAQYYLDDQGALFIMSDNQFAAGAISNRAHRYEDRVAVFTVNDTPVHMELKATSEGYYAIPASDAEQEFVFNEMTSKEAIHFADSEAGVTFVIDMTGFSEANAIVQSAVETL